MGTHPIFESDFDCLTDDGTDPGLMRKFETVQSAEILNVR